MFDQIIEGSDTRMERHLAEERAKDRAARVSPAASAAAVAQAYPGVQGSIHVESTPAPKAADAIAVLKTILGEPYVFEVTDEERDALRAYSLAVRELDDRIMANTRDAVWKAYKSTPPPPEGRPPRELAEQQSREVMRHAKRERAELPAAYAKVILDLARRATEEVELRLAGEQERNASQCRQLGIPAEDTGPIRALRGALSWIKDRERSIEANPQNATLELAKVFVPDL